MGTVRLILGPSLFALSLFSFFSQALLAQSGGTSSGAQLSAGAIELGIAGALTVIEGSTSGLVAIRAARFQTAPSSLWSGEVAVGFSHRNALTTVDLQSTLGWQRRFESSSAYPFIAVGGGLRQEWLGSFRQARYPLGFNLGLRNLISSHIGIRTEYWFRRVLGDPVANFSEHRLVVGISLFVKNSQ